MTEKLEDMTMKELEKELKDTNFKLVVFRELLKCVRKTKE